MRARSHHRVVIIGAGFAGVGMGVRLLEQGIGDFVILERNESVGGTWFEHTYPGCGCDIPTHLYSFSFARNPRWSRLFPKQEEILAYVRRIADEYGVTPHIRFSTEMEHASWDETAGRWRVRTPDGELTCDVLVSAIGATAEPDEPEIPGIDSFAGHRFHSARWDHDHDLADDRVAVIGTGPAAAQFIPRIQPRVGHLAVFQRTPPWVIPHFDRPVPAAERLLYRFVPQVQDVQRNLFFALYEATGVGLRGHTELIAPIEALGRAHLRRQVADPELRAKLMPDYRFGCKRPILSNTYYPALARENVLVETDGIDRVEGHELVTRGGTRHEVDTIITAIGYRYSRALLVNRISNGLGETLGQVWNQSPRAYLGTTVPAFPNLFILLGPNAIGINSVIFTLESQIAYVIDALAQMSVDGWGRLEVRPEPYERFIAEVDRRSEGSVWTDGGCKAYYTDAEGRNFAIYPGFAAGFRRRTRRFDPEAYALSA
ncbi:MAG TPA: NAD(P)/FAD-dependent oxidoreductase [Solirubrobacteraceae bacterium]|nr:NAD(P)/FAD-dependent oxidoreductase [Solirubrobacteraceae bacterium]